MSIVEINSESLIPIENHFRVAAGPGAGKTYWLSNHVRNVLQNSKRLKNSRKIACITYTNVAVETLLKRLNGCQDSVEISTLHSFLYKHIVKPYAKFIPDDYNLNVSKIDGHDDIVLSNYSFLQEWKDRTAQKRITDDNTLVKAFREARWKFDSSGNLIIRPDYPKKVNGYAIKNNSYFEYKKMTWEKGIIHHDDVLFFSHVLLSNYPFIQTILRAKFPYFFIDEFQDTHPIQARILNAIGQNETIVGIVGDQAQSIYSFQGAVYSQFQSFNLNFIKNYVISENRRSTNQIIDLLNSVRTDINQHKFRNQNGDCPSLYVGNPVSILDQISQDHPDIKICSLSRDNITANTMKKAMNNNIPSEDLLQKLQETDSNKERKRLVFACIKSTELAIYLRYKEAIKEMERLFPDEKDKTKKRRLALKNLNFLVNNYSSYSASSLLNYHQFLCANIQSTAKVTKGAPKRFYEGHTYAQLSVCVKIIEDASAHRTIHKAKGDEFDNVLLVLKEESDLQFIIDPDLENNEEHRINYVALSRAREKLFIAVPSLSKNVERRLRKNLVTLRSKIS